MCYVFCGHVRGRQKEETGEKEERNWFLLSIAKRARHMPIGDGRALLLVFCVCPCVMSARLSSAPVRLFSFLWAGGKRDMRT